MLTTLLEETDVKEWKYYFMRSENGKALYCEALTPTEAACKYMLASNKLEKIVIIGPEDVVKSEDETEPVALRDGTELFNAAAENLSTYGLLRYRLAEYSEDRKGNNYTDTILSDDEKEKTISFLNDFFKEHVQNDVDRRLNRYFHLLAQNNDLQEAFDKALCEWAPEADYERYKLWALYYMYDEMKDSFKMEPLEDNADVEILLATLREDDSIRFPRRMMNTLDQYENSSTYEGTNMYLGIQNTDASLILDIFNIIDMTRILPGDEIKVCKTISTTCSQEVLANEIIDMSTMQSVSGLLSGVEAFLKYGKTKSIIEYWNQFRINNPSIDHIIFAMRNIDNGISLCDISDIERGIKSIRDIIRSGEEFEGNSPIEQAMAILLAGVRRDYGRLLETDEIEFIDLVKWAYKKEFWQQTLTLIESRAPRDFVKRGFYFYCDSEENKDSVTDVLANIYNDFKPFERYKMEDVSHYYIKFYNRSKQSRNKRGLEHIRDYAKIRVGEIDNTDSKEIRACSACEDRSALEDLLFAYYYVGDTRNSTNHAMDTFEGFSEIMKDSDNSERMETIKQCVDLFIHSYEKVEQLVEGKDVNVVTISYDEVTSRANELYRKSFKDNDKSKTFKKWSNSKH